jgi:hypothetical protein
MLGLHPLWDGGSMHTTVNLVHEAYLRDNFLANLIIAVN